LVIRMAAGQDKRRLVAAIDRSRRILARRVA
jgi:hypothetical protein